MATVQSPLPALPAGWSAEKDYKVLSRLSSAVQRNIEPVGPHFLAHARRVCFPALSMGIVVLIGLATSQPYFL